MGPFCRVESRQTAGKMNEWEVCIYSQNRCQLEGPVPLVPLN
jgi:hypothetical protein